MFNGAFSTLLAVMMLVGARSYVFETFFRALFLTVVFGMGQGLLLLPVLLSWANPASLQVAETAP